MERFILIHYGEIGLKGNNKAYFQKKLKKLIDIKLKPLIKNFKGSFVTLDRVLVQLFDEFDEDKISAELSTVSGIKNFQFVYKSSTNFDYLCKNILHALDSENLEFKNFCVRVKRSQNFEYTSVEFEKKLGTFLFENIKNAKVKMHEADLIFNIEIFNNSVFFSFKKSSGKGGLPSNSAGKVICLISGGIDSPVAAYKMIGRGARVIFVNLHSYPYSNKSEMQKVKDLVEILSKYQTDTKLYLVPFIDIQKAIATNEKIPAKFRVVLYRRMMIRIAEMIARKNKAKAVITGDSLGQVASQTLDNIFAIHGASTIPLIQPLISFDKEDVIKISKEIGTFDISKLPCSDTCSMFSPKTPVLNANPLELAEYEKFLDIEDLILKAIAKLEIVAF